MYFSSVILVIVVDFIFASGFAIYGIAIFVQKYTHALGSGLRRELIQTMVVTIVFAACFALRMVMFLYRPITGRFLNGTLYRVLAYFIPEVVAVALQVSVVYIMNHNSPSSSAATNNGGLAGGRRRGRRRHNYSRTQHGDYSSSSAGAGAGADADATRTRTTATSASANPHGFTTGSSGNGGSIQRPSVEDDVYYHQADQDLRASAMPAPLANAHERLISPPRPLLRNNFSSTSAGTSSAATAAAAAAATTSAANSIQSNASSLPHSSNNASMPSSPPHAGYSGGGIPLAIASAAASRLSGSLSPISFSPSHEQPLLRSFLSSDRLPLQVTDDLESGRGGGGGGRAGSGGGGATSDASSTNVTTDEDSDAFEIDDTASLIPKRHSRRG